MKLFRKIVILTILFIIFSFEPNDDYDNPSDYEAVIMYRDDLEKSISIGDPQPLTGLDKIYYKDDYIFLTKRYKGMHVIDNHDPENPVNIAFINIPGCQDVAIKQNILYSDNSTDLVGINISGIPASIAQVSRIAKAFPNPLPPDLDYIPKKFRAYNRPKNTVIVEWKKKPVSNSVY